MVIVERGTASLGGVALTAGSRNRENARRVSPSELRWVPFLCLIAACSLLLIAIANTGARDGAAWAPLPFWGGLVILYSSIVARLAAPSTTRAEGVALVAVLAFALYLVKLLNSPLIFTNYDETLHWRTADDILQSGHLFAQNPLLPISPLYPGLENVTTALVNLSGLSVFQAGTVVIGVARLVFMIALYLTYEAIGRSPSVAGLAAALYMANPTFIFFGGMFKYESLALSFFGLALFTLVRRDGIFSPGYRLTLTATALLALGSVVATHHLTAYALTGLLALWALVKAYGAPPRSATLPLRRIILLGAILNCAWLIFVASATVQYLAPLFGTALTQVVQLIMREGESSRELFTSSSGEVAPLWQRLTSLAGVGLILLGSPFGLVQIARRHRRSAITLTLAALALGYPVTLVLRLVGDTRGWEVAHRSSVFLYLGIGYVLALGISEFWLRPRPLRVAWIRRIVGPLHRWPTGLRMLPVVVASTVVFLSGVLSGWPPQWVLPGPYLASAATRSIEPQGLNAAYWARANLGPNNRFTADVTNFTLLSSYGGQFFVSTLNGGVDTSWVFYAPAFGPSEREILRRARVRYLVIDLRLTTHRPMQPPYVGDDPRGATVAGPLDPALLEKFDEAEGMSRVFDSGSIIIYDVGAITNVR